MKITTKTERGIIERHVPHPDPVKRLLEVLEVYMSEDDKKKYLKKYE